MLRFLPGPIRGVIFMMALVINTLFWCVPLFTVAIFRALIPLRRWQGWCAAAGDWLARGWIGVNNAMESMVGAIEWEIRQSEGLEPRGWYLVLSNHQSWSDILVLQKIFNRRIPMLKFFIKKELFWFPVMGQAWWALDFPFMKRYSQSFLKKHPHLKGKDLEITRKACEKYKTMPVSVMNFIEGTRFRPDKHRRQQSPYTHLLRPKAGGAAFVLGAMGSQISRILDVTIVYPHGTKGFWDYLCGNIKKIQVRIDVLPVAPALIGDYALDPAYRRRFQKWLNILWAQKDAYIDAVLAGSAGVCPEAAPVVMAPVTRQRRQES